MNQKKPLPHSPAELRAFYESGLTILEIAAKCKSNNVRIRSEIVAAGGKIRKFNPHPRKGIPVRKR